MKPIFCIGHERLGACSHDLPHDGASLSVLVEGEKRQWMADCSLANKGEGVKRGKGGGEGGEAFEY